MSEETKKCINCGNTIPQGEGKEVKNGTLCTKCDKKSKSKVYIILGAVFVAIIAIIIYLLCNKIDSFEGIGVIDDEVTLKEIEIKSFEISKATAISTPTTPGAAIDNIELFKAIVNENISIKTGDDVQLDIPTIAVQFGLNSSDLSSASVELIVEYASIYCQTAKDAVISVEGYTCDLGTDRYNNILSEKRADVVKDQLISAGIPVNKIITKGYGKSMYGKLDLVGREANRRVIVSIK